MKIWIKKENLIKEVQWKIAIYLAKYKYQFIGDFKSQSVIKKSKNHSQKRELCDMKHYQLKQKIKFKAYWNDC